MWIELACWRGLPVAGVALLGACDPRRQSVVDEAPADAAPGCPVDYEGEGCWLVEP
ncbi:MAG: hypothetical protein R3F65_31545 [bacterium]